MTRQKDDPCPQCKTGKLTVGSDKEIYENPDGGHGGHISWLCDNCGKTFRDFQRGVTGSIGTISDSGSVSK